jgi:uncharacterized repeat protein (TIGR03803 family)
MYVLHGERPADIGPSKSKLAKQSGNERLSCELSTPDGRLNPSLLTKIQQKRISNQENGMNFKYSALNKHRSLTSASLRVVRGTVAALAVILILMPNSWAASREIVLHTFNLATAGDPVSGLALDANGNLYGTTRLGGPGSCGEGCGVVFKLSKNSQGGITYNVLHTFAGFPDGGNPFGAPIVDSTGNVYGTTTDGGQAGCGVVYRLSPSAGGKYEETILHSFNKLNTRNADGCNPESYLVPDAAGNLYGTTNTGGGGGVNGTFCDNGCGSVFKLAPNGDGTYTESVIHSFPGTKGNTDGQNPVGGLVFDSAGNLWGSTQGGGSVGDGTVFELTPNSDGTYTESTLYSFTGASTGFFPNTDLVIDKANNLYGTAVNGGLGHGVVFKVTPQPGGGVQESIVHAFALCNSTVCPDGLSPFNGLTIDANGVLYGTVDLGGGATNQCSTGAPALGCGIVYKLTPNAQGEFTETILYRFQGFADGATPEDDRLVIDTHGNIFGSTAQGGDSKACPSDGFGTPGGCGVVFVVTP